MTELSRNPASASGFVSPAAPSLSATAPAILMVDDQPARLLTYEATLSGLDVRCIRALSGEDALARLLEQEFACILLDVSMPGMDGFEVARRVHQLARLERTPIIFVTGVHDSPLDQLRGYEVGAIDYIGIPIVPSVLRSKVAILVELHQRWRESERRYRALMEEFLAMLSHELRNPVAPIMSAAEALRLIHAGDERTKGLTNIIHRQATSLSRLLDDLLDVARITQRHVQPRMETVALESCVEMALETAGPFVRDRRHNLTVDRLVEPLYVKADRVRLAQCLVNLLTNAAKYTNAGGEINIRSYADGGDAVIEVSDNGDGIPAEFLPRMFDLFSQSERTLDRSQGGLGVGLCVCKELIEMQGGSVSGTSPGLGQGATFSLRLPLADVPSAGVGLSETRRDARRILIVDDNCDAADALTTLLRLEGHEVQTVYDAERGLTLLASFAPDVALLDIGLPGMSGYELAGRMKELNIPQLKLVAVSGYGQPDDRARSKRAGFDAHLVKPVDITELREVL